MPHIVTIKSATDDLPRQSEAGCIELRDGSLLVAWQEYFGGGERAGEDDGPNRIIAAVSRDGGLTWGDERTLVNTPAGDKNLYGASFLRANNGDLLFFWYTNHVCGEGQPLDISAFVQRSRDEGKTFSAPETVFAHKPYFFLNNSAKRLSTGRIIFALDRLTGELWTKTDHFIGGALFSDDDGRTWCEGKGWVDLPLRGCMENHVEELRDGALISVMRNQLGSVFTARSGDGGDTWSKPQTTGLSAPESCPDLVRTPSTGDLLLIWNHAEYDPAFGSHFGKRSPLTAAVSRDDGKTWGPPRNLEDDPTRAFSNPAVTFFGKDKAILTYWTCPYTDNWLMQTRLIDLRAAIFDVAWLYG